MATARGAARHWWSPPRRPASGSTACWLARVAELSRSRHKALILAGRVAIDGATIRDPGHRVNAGGTIVLDLPPPESVAIGPEDIPLKVVYEDDELIVIDKPAGLVVHPAAGNWTGTLVNALVAHCGESLSGIGGVRRPGIVHRLDKDTTGADGGGQDRPRPPRAQPPVRRPRPQRAAAPRLSGVRLGRARPAARHHRQADRPPPARPRQDGGARRAAARPSPTGRCSSAIAAADGKPVASLLACRLETGRTHQIRVHLASIGHPLLGDDGLRPGFKTKASQLGPDARAALEALGRQALHAYLLAIEHPSQGKNLEFRSELPDDLASFTPWPRCAGHVGLRRKHQPINGLGVDAGGHADVTPS